MTLAMMSRLKSTKYCKLSQSENLLDVSVYGTLDTQIYLSLNSFCGNFKLKERRLLHLLSLKYYTITFGKSISTPSDWISTIYNLLDSSYQDKSNGSKISLFGLILVEFW